MGLAEARVGDSIDRMLGSLWLQTLVACAATAAAVGGALSARPMGAIAPMVAVPVMWRLGVEFGRREA